MKEWRKKHFHRHLYLYSRRWFLFEISSRSQWAGFCFVFFLPRRAHLILCDLRAIVTRKISLAHPRQERILTRQRAIQPANSAWRFTGDPRLIKSSLPKRGVSQKKIVGRASIGKPRREKTAWKRWNKNRRRREKEKKERRGRPRDRSIVVVRIA